MARPKTKADLIVQVEVNYIKLTNLIGSLSSEEQDRTFPNGMLNRNIRDVIGHLHEWHLMMLSWYKLGMAGQKLEMPAKGYTWKTTPELNTQIQKKFDKTDLNDVLALFNNSHNQLQELIKSHSNEELFVKKRYKWTGSTSLGAYLISATSSHYDWAIKLIKKARL